MILMDAKNMQEADLIKKLSDLQEEAHNLIAGFAAPGASAFETHKRLDRIDAAIAEIESKLESGGFNSKSHERSVSNIQRMKSNLLLLGRRLLKDLPINVNVHGMNMIPTLGLLVDLVECTDKNEVKVANLAACVSTAERPDFSPVQARRDLQFDSGDSDFVSPYFLFDLLSWASKATDRAVVVTRHENSLRIGEGVFEENKRETRFGLALALCLMGVFNKIEQLFSPTSVIHQMARVCYTMSRDLLGDNCFLEASTGHIEWTCLVYPQFSLLSSVDSVVTDALKMFESQYNEYGTPQSRNCVRIDSSSSTPCSGLTRLGILTVLEGLRGTKAVIQMEGNIVNITTDSPLNEMHQEAAAQFVKAITVTSTEHSHSIKLEV
jgi:hypothetical protein